MVHKDIRKYFLVKEDNGEFLIYDSIRLNYLQNYVQDLNSLPFESYIIPSIFQNKSKTNFIFIPPEPIFTAEDWTKFLKS